MAGFFSDSDEDKAVDELLAQAKEMTILEQVAAINCAGLDDSSLPHHLETRFRKLKSFPSSTAKQSSIHTKSFNFDDPVNVNKMVGAREDLPSTCSKKCPLEEKCLSPSKSSENGSFSPFKKNRREKMSNNERKSHSSSSWEGSSSSRSVSPPVKSGCFLCSPKKVLSRKKNKENKGFDLGLDWGKHDDEFLSDLSNYSTKSRKNIMKKAAEEEEEICREADKIVKWAKQASARMEHFGFENELSDDENSKFS